jgi:hypothetical protein
MPKMVGVEMPLLFTLAQSRIALNAKYHKSLLDLGADSTADHPVVCIEASASN